MKLARKRKAHPEQDSMKRVFEGDVSLNQTSDFAGGCSQYKSVVQQVQVRKVINRLPRQTRSGTANESRNETKNDQSAISSSISGTSEQPQTLSSKRSAREGSGPSTEDPNSTPSEVVPTDTPKSGFQEHEGTASEGAGESASVDSVQCEICLMNLTDFDAAARLHHVNQCIDDKMAGSASSKGDQVLEDCHLCGKKMPHLSALFRSLHITHCADKIKAENDQLKAKEAAKTKRASKVLDCPLCGQKLKTQAARKSHLKKCGQKFDVPPNVVMERVRQQEEEHNSQLKVGSSNEGVPPQRQKKPRSRNQNTPQNPTPGSSNSNAVPVQNPHFVDDQIQLAMALSRSLHEKQLGIDSREPLASIPSTSSENSVEPAKIEKVNNANINPSKDAFSLLMTPNKPVVPPVKKRGRKKERDDSMPWLLATSKEELADKIADKMAAMILPQGNEDFPGSTPEMAATQLPDKYSALLPNGSENGVIISLWGCSSLKDETRDNGYYVKELMPPISPCKVKAGSKIKSMASIPGRGLDDSVLMAKEESVKRPKVHDKVLNETLVPSTQTAVMLAQLADGDMTLPPDCDPSAAEASGFLKDESVNNNPEACPSKSSLDTLAADFSHMVNNRLCSDLTIRTRNTSFMYAHKFVLAARCPRFYQEVCDSHELDLEEFSLQSVRSLLGFLYSGQLELSKSFLPEVRALAQRWQVAELTAILDSVKSTLQSEKGEVLREGVEEADKTQDHDLNELLKQVWGSDEEESESSSDEDDQGDDPVDEAADQDARANPCDFEADFGAVSSLSEKSPSKKLSQMSEDEIIQILSPETESVENEEIDAIADDSEISDSELIESESASEQKENYQDVEMETGNSEDLPALDLSAENKDEELEVTELQSESSLKSDGEDGDGDGHSQNTSREHGESELESAFIDLRNSDDESDSETIVSNKGEGDANNVSDVQNKSLHSSDNDNDPDEDDQEGLQVSVSTPSAAGRSTEEATPDLFGDSFVYQKGRCSVSQTPVGVTGRQESKDKDNGKINDKERRGSFGDEVVLFDSDDDVKELDRTEEYPMKGEGEDEEMHGGKGPVEDDSGCPNSMFYERLDNTLTNSPVFSSQKTAAPGNSLTQGAKVNLQARLMNEEENKDTGNTPANSGVACTLQTEDFEGNDEAVMDEIEHSSVPSLSQKRKRENRNQADLNSPLSTPGQCGSPVFKSRKVCTCTPKKVAPLALSQEVGPIDLTLSDGEEGRLDMDSSAGSGGTSKKGHADAVEDTSKVVDAIVDVWEGFDDDGGFDDVGYEGLEILEEFRTPNPPRPITPKTRTPKKTKEKTPVKMDTLVVQQEPPRTNHGLSPSPARGPSGAGRSPVVEEYDPPTDMDTDVSALLNDSAIWDDQNEPVFTEKSAPERPGTFQTPANPKPTTKVRSEVVASPFTPMPNYDGMRTPMLKDQCKKFGIKVQPKKKMVKSLKHIYHELHQYETDTDLEEGHVPGQSQVVNDSPPWPPLRVFPSTARQAGTDAGREWDSSSDSDEDDNHIGKLMETFVEGSSGKESGSDGSPVKDATQGKRGGKSKTVARKRPPKLAFEELRVKLLEFVHADEELYLKILHYEPLSFDELAATLKQNGIHAKDNVLVQCLDELNIVFTTKTDDGKSKWRKGKKKTSPRK